MWRRAAWFTAGAGVVMATRRGEGVRRWERGGSGRMPGRGWGRGVGRRPGEKGLEAGRRLGLHDVPGGAARGGPAYVVSMRDVEASLGAAVNLKLDAWLSARGQDGNAAV